MKLFQESVSVLWKMSRYSRGGVNHNIPPMLVCMIKGEDQGEESLNWEPINAGGSIEEVFFSAAMLLKNNSDTRAVSFMFDSIFIHQPCWMMMNFTRDGIFPIYSAKIEACQKIYQEAPVQIKAPIDLADDKTVIEKLSAYLHGLEENEVYDSLPAQGYMFLSPLAKWEIDFKSKESEFLSMLNSPQPDQGWN